MTRPAPGISSGAQSFNWLVNRFADGTAGVIAAIAVSADGLLIAMSDAMERASADRLAAIASATLGLANGVSESYARPAGQGHHRTRARLSARLHHEHRLLTRCAGIQAGQPGHHRL